MEISGLMFWKNLQIGLSWDPVELCDPYIYDCDWGDETIENQSQTYVC